MSDRLPRPLTYAAPPAPPARGWTFLLVAIWVCVGVLVAGSAMFAVRSATAPAPPPGAATTRPAPLPPSLPGGGR